jgi:hypothetical protein
MRILYINYALWKSIAQTQGFKTYHCIGDLIAAPPATETQRRVWCGTPEVIYSVDIDDTSDLTDWQANVEPTSALVVSEDEALANITGLGHALQPRDRAGNPIITVDAKAVSEAIYATHNFALPCTWYSKSLREENEALEVTGGIWSSPANNVDWIDMKHGRVFDEEGLSEDQKILEPGSPHGYELIIEVDGVLKTERAPFADSGGEYTVDYGLGQVDPQGENWNGKDVRAWYSYSGSSEWIMPPLPGKALFIEKAEIQFSGDVGYLDTIVMQALGYVDTFAPDLWDQQALVGPFLGGTGAALPPVEAGSPGDLFYETTTPQVYYHAGVSWQPLPAGPLPGGTRIPIETTKYKTIDQIIDEAVGAFPEIPPISAADPRGISKSRHVFQFHYSARKSLYSSLGMQISIMLENETAFTGERATATFYCISRDDNDPVQALVELGVI